MQRQVHCLVGLALSTLSLLTACRTSHPPVPAAPTPTTLPSSLTATPPNPNIPAPSKTPSPPTKVTPTTTATPLPTWPERWEPAHGPYGGFIEAVAVNPGDPTMLYAAGTGGAVYQSRDGGETWSPGERVVPSTCPFSGLVIDANVSATVYAANACTGVFKTSDEGATWSHASNGIDGGVSSLIQSPHAPGLLLAADYTGRIYRSRDGAASWEPISDGLPGEPIQCITISGPDTYWATTVNGEGGSLYRFKDGAWSAVPFGQPSETRATSVLVDPADPAILYVGLESVSTPRPDADVGFLLRSIDSGLNWSPLSSLGRAAITPDDPAGTHARVHVLGKGEQSGVLYVTSSGGFFSSSDAGDTWQRAELPEGLFTASELRQIAIDPTNNDVLYLPLRSAGILKSEDGGRSWQTSERGLDNMVVGVVATHPTDPARVYVAAAGSGNIYTSDDYGDSWQKLIDSNLGHPAARNVQQLIFDPDQPDTIYQALDVARVFRSDDGGANWSAAWPAFRFSSIYSLVSAPSDPTILYASKNGFGLFRGDDGGNAWQILPEPGLDYAFALAVHPDNPGFVLSGDTRKPFETAAQLHRSKDGGVTWDVVLEVPDAVGITSAAFDPRVEPFFAQGARPADPTRIYAASTGPQGVLWYSNDAGDSWRPVNKSLNFTNVRALAVVPHRPGVVFAGLWGGGTWRTDDAGQSWRRLPGDPAASAVEIAVNPENNNVIYIADATTPHLYRSTDDGHTWELLFDAGPDYDRLVALALAPSDPTLLYVSASRTGENSATGTVFRVDTKAPTGENASDITGELPGAPTNLAVHRRDPRRIFAVVPGAGVWKTVDEGASWRQVKTGLPEASFFQIVVDPIMPETLYLTGGHDVHTETFERAGLNPDEMHGIWKSIDDGNTWVKVGGATFGRASGPIRAVAFHPEDQRIMYAVGEGGVYLSPDGGETWTGINGRLSFFPMNAIATDGQNLFVGSAGAGVFSGTIHPLIRTADWTAESTLVAPIQHIQITLHPEDPQTIFASAYPGGVFKTTDGGTTWSAHNFGLPTFAVADALRQGYYALAIAPSAPNTLYAGLYTQGVYRSDDGAATWRPVFGDDSQLQGAKVQALLVHPDDPDVVYVATQPDERPGGVWRTVDGGRSWSEFNSGLPGGGDVRALAVGADGQLYAGSRGYGLYTRAASPQGEDESWRQLPDLANWGTPWPSWEDRRLYQRTSLLISHTDANTLYAATFPGGVFKTTDAGLFWRERNVGLGVVGVLTLVSSPADEQMLFAGTTNGVARSSDGAATWQPWDAGWPPGQWVFSIAFDPTNPDIIYACSKNGENHGEGRQGYRGTVMKSTDGGATWFEITTGLDLDQAFYTILIDRFDPNVVYLATEREGVFISRDGGATWSSWNEGLWNRVTGGNGYQGADVLELSADGRLLYFGTAGSGVWRRPAEALP